MRLRVAAGARDLPIRLTPTSRKRLRRGHRVVVRTSVTFTATGGVPVTKNAKLTVLP